MYLYCKEAKIKERISYVVCLNDSWNFGNFLVCIGSRIFGVVYFCK